MRCITLTLIALLISVRVGSATFQMGRSIPFSTANMLRLMNQIGIAYPDVVFAQARLETGNFTSKVFRENKNMFGMKLPRLRKTTAIGEQNNHAKYTSWVQSLADYKLWQSDVLKKANTKRKYLRYLSKNYAEDKKYIHKLKQML